MASRLRIERLPLTEVLRRGGDGVAPLAGLAYGLPSDADWCSGVDTQRFSPSEPTVDVWFGAPTAPRAGRTGDVRWQTDGDWLWGAIDVAEVDGADDLAALAQAAYADLFRTLDRTGVPHLLRIWNYLPRINDDGGGLERYRQFNLGRQLAFLAADRPAFDGAPAACALGVRRGGLCIRFLAGPRPPRPIENPRQVSAYRYPATYGPRAPTFSRAALADVGGAAALFISGTASIVGHETVHAGDVSAQTRETLRNLEAVVTAANDAGSSDFTVEALDAVVYVRRPDDVPTVMAVLDGALGADSHFVRHAVVLQADICRSDLLVEIEAHAFASDPRRA